MGAPCCFKKDGRYSKFVKNGMTGCLNQYKSNRFLGTYIKPKTFDSIEEIYMWCKKDFEKHGFPTYIIEQDGDILLFADKKDYPTKTSWMVGVSLTRYATYKSTQKYFTKYRILREYGFTMPETIFILSFMETNKVISLAFYGTYIPRNKPDLKAHTRQSGRSVFYTRSKLDSIKNYRDRMFERNKIMSHFNELKDYIFRIENKKLTEKRLDKVKSLMKKYIDKWK